MTGALVTTTLGDIRESDLDITTFDEPSTEQVWVMVRECRYKGSNLELAKHVGELVRRDVWATIKYGHAVAGEATL